jgi:hypothetical protein
MTAQLMKLKYKVKNGASKKSTLLALFGIITSFKISFSASAKGCKIPTNPVIFGPFRRCIDPNTRLSAKVNKATVKIIKIRVISVKNSRLQ